MATVATPNETITATLARWAAGLRYEDLSETAVREAKRYLLDSLGCAIGATRLEPLRRLRDQIEGFGGRPLATMIGGGKTSPDRAAFYNGALMRHLGFNDSHLSGKRLCHPSDGLPAVLAASEYAGASGRDLRKGVAGTDKGECRGLGG